MCVHVGAWVCDCCPNPLGSLQLKADHLNHTLILAFKPRGLYLRPSVVHLIVLLLVKMSKEKKKSTQKLVSQGEPGTQCSHSAIGTWAVCHYSLSLPVISLVSSEKEKSFTKKWLWHVLTPDWDGDRGIPCNFVLIILKSFNLPKGNGKNFSDQWHHGGTFETIASNVVLHQFDLLPR